MINYSQQSKRCVSLNLLAYDSFLSLQVVGAPGIKFVGGNTLQSLGNAELKEVPKTAAAPNAASAATTGVNSTSSTAADDAQDDCEFI